MPEKKTMTAKQLKLAGEMLALAADQFSNHGCNDWEWPETWTQDERDAFAKAYHEYNGDLENFRPGQRMNDYSVMYLLGALLEDEAQS